MSGTIVDGFRLSVLGMSSVFTFLILMILSIKTLSTLLKCVPKSTSQSKKKPIAAIVTAAIHKYRKDNEVN